MTHIHPLPTSREQPTPGARRGHRHTSSCCFPPRSPLCLPLPVAEKTESLFHRRFAQRIYPHENTARVTKKLAITPSQTEIERGIPSHRKMLVPHQTPAGLISTKLRHRQDVAARRLPAAWQLGKESDGRSWGAYPHFQQLFVLCSG